MVRFLTAGESHGQALVAVLEGLPAGLVVDLDAVQSELRRRQGGYGRGRRMAIEDDRAEALSGIRLGRTTGAPVALLVRNKDWANWQHTMSVQPEPASDATGARRAPVTRPRPGHADLAGAIKYGHHDLRDVLERASARETAARVAAGSVARQLLRRFDIEVASHVVAIGSVAVADWTCVSFDRLRAIAPDSPLRCVDPDAETRMIEEIDRARASGDTVGGAFEVIAEGVPAGLGSYVQWDRKLDGRLAQAIMSIPAIKAVGIGTSVRVASLPGSLVHDEILADSRPSTRGLPGIARPTNRAGGLEGGVTNGEAVRLTGYMKPIATLMKPLASVDLETMADAPAAIERSDVCAVPAAAVVAEAMVCLVLADAFTEKFGGDSIDDIERSYGAWKAELRRRLEPAGSAPPAGSSDHP
jgi:chorismate synthase